MKYCKYTVPAHHLPVVPTLAGAAVVVVVAVVYVSVLVVVTEVTVVAVVVKCDSNREQFIFFSITILHKQGNHK